MTRRLLVPLAVAAAVAGATTAASMAWPALAKPTTPVRTPGVAPVVERTLVCPDLSGARRTTGQATMAVLPERAGVGRAVMSPLRGPSPVVLPALSRPGTGGFAETKKAGGPVSVAATGPLAAGVAAEVVIRAEAGTRRGLAETRCSSAARDTWFVGGSTAVGAAASLLLVNADDVPATADVSLLTAAGPVAPRSAQGLEVPPRRALRLALESLAPEMPALATRVVVTSGRLAASLSDNRTRAKLALGVDYVPPAAAPSRRAVVPGFAFGPGPRPVLLGVPGPDDATVELRVVTTDGSFVPAGLNAMRVPAGTLASADLAKVLAGRAAAVVVTSDVPVVAGGSSGQVDPYTGEGEFAWSTATPALAGPALLPDNRVRGPAQSILLLTAPAAAATVDLTGLTPGRLPVHPARISVPAGHTVAVSLQGLTPSGRFSLVVTPAPGSGPVYGTRMLYERWTRGTWLSQLTLERTDGIVRLPIVVDDPAAGSS